FVLSLQLPSFPPQSLWPASTPKSWAPPWLLLSVSGLYTCRMRMRPRCAAIQISVPHQRNVHLVHYKSYEALPDPVGGQDTGRPPLRERSNRHVHHAWQSALESVPHHRRISTRQQGPAVPSDGISGTHQQYGAPPTIT